MLNPLSHFLRQGKEDSDRRNVMERKLIIGFGSLVTVLMLINLFLVPHSGNNGVSYEVLKEYGNELRSKGLYRHAIDVYEEYLKSGNISKRVRANIQYIIADIYRDNLKDFDNALAHYIKIKYIDPNSPLMKSVNQKIVECLENSGRTREAQLALESSTLMGSKKVEANDTVVAKIDSDLITLREFQDWYDRLSDDVKKEYSTREARKKLLQQYIGQELLYRMAVRKGYQNSPEVLKQLFDIKKSLMLQKLLQDELKSKINISKERFGVVL